MIRRLLPAAVVVLLAIACGETPTDEGPARFPLARDWHYTADQLPLTRTRIEGEIRFTFQSGLRFDGAVDVKETDDFGQIERRTGLVSGRFRDSLNVDFDLRLDNEVRRHVGRIAGDSITGDWIQQSGTSSASGGFRMTRIQR